MDQLQPDQTAEGEEAADHPQRSEVRKILSLIRLPRYRVCLSTIYSCGLRLQQGTHVQMADIDSARMVLHVRHGKGHVHYIVAGGGFTENDRWKSSRDQFLVPGKPLNVIFRAKVRAEFKKASLFDQVDNRVWNKEWVVDLEPVGSGEAAFKYLAPYIFRVAISNNRILKLEDARVTFKYKESATDQIRFSTLTAEEFIRRFLQHVLPERFVKVRYYGLLSSSNRSLLAKVRQQLGARPAEHSPSVADQVQDEDGQQEDPLRCPECGVELTLVRSVAAKGREPP